MTDCACKTQHKHIADGQSELQQNTSRYYCILFLFVQLNRLTLLTVKCLIEKLL